MKKLKIVLLSILLSIVTLVSSDYSPLVHAETKEKLLIVNLFGLELGTDFKEADTYYSYTRVENLEAIDIFDLNSNQKIATFELDFAEKLDSGIQPLSTYQGSGAYRKYLANGLTIVHSFGFTYTGTDSNKKVVSVLWNNTSADGWSYFKKIDGANSASRVNQSTISGSYSIVIQAEIETEVTVEIKKTLLTLEFGGNIIVGSKYYGTKSFHGSWTVKVNSSGGGSLPPCDWNGSIWICPQSIGFEY